MPAQSLGVALDRLDDDGLTDVVAALWRSRGYRTKRLDAEASFLLIGERHEGGTDLVGLAWLRTSDADPAPGLAAAWRLCEQYSIPDVCVFSTAGDDPLATRADEQGLEFVDASELAGHLEAAGLQERVAERVGVDLDASSGGDGASADHGESPDDGATATESESVSEDEADDEAAVPDEADATAATDRADSPPDSSSADDTPDDPAEDLSDDAPGDADDAPATPASDPATAANDGPADRRPAPAAEPTANAISLTRHDRRIVAGGGGVLLAFGLWYLFGGPTVLGFGTCMGPCLIHSLVAGFPYGSQVLGLLTVLVGAKSLEIAFHGELNRSTYRRVESGVRTAYGWLESEVRTAYTWLEARATRVARRARAVGERRGR